MEKQIDTLDDLETEALRLVGTLARGSQATLITLSGELGAGKTAFTKAIARALGIDEVVNSPTFVLEKVYELPEEQAFRRLVHIDAYRLESGSELEPLKLTELLADADNLILLEWPEKVADALPAPQVHISITLRPDGSRAIHYA